MYQWMKFPYKIEPAADMNEKWKKLESVKILTDSAVLRVPRYYPKFAETIYNFQVRPDDVWVITFPRSGTTLSEEMVWMIVNDDYETAEKVPLLKRFPWLESYTFISDEVREKAKSKINDKEELKYFYELVSPQWLALEKYTNRRFITSHLQFDLLPPGLLTSGCKILYVARNPKDVSYSLFRLRYPYAPDEDFAEFWNLFQNDCRPHEDIKVIASLLRINSWKNSNLTGLDLETFRYFSLLVNYCPYWEHVKGGWNHRENENFCFIFYEDIIQDMKASIRKIATFMKKDMTDQQVDRLADHLNIDNFRKNKSVNRQFGYYLHGKKGQGHAGRENPIKKGKIGNGKSHFTDELNAKANEWIIENYKNTDLRFPVNLKNI